MALTLVACVAGGCGDDSSSGSPDAGPSGGRDAGPIGGDSGATGPDGGSSTQDAGTGPIGCAAAGFAFGTFSDTYEGQEGGLDYVLGAMGSATNVQFLTSGGDTPSYERIREHADDVLSAMLPCTATEYPWFPAAGNHDVEDPAAMMSWAGAWAAGWDVVPSATRLARQLPGVTRFVRGPTSVTASSGGTSTIAPGTIYAFDYGNAHFVFVNTYEQDPLAETGDNIAGVWDVNGAGTTELSSSQLDWLRDNLASTTQPVKFVFGHVAVVAPCYENPGVCPGAEPTMWPFWSEHNSNFHMTEFARVLSDTNVTAYFHGHDHVPSRMIIDGARAAVYSRLYYDVYDDPMRPTGRPSDWEGLQTAGRFWQVDAGTVYTNGGSYVVTTVSATSVRFDIHTYVRDTATDAYADVVWDTWTRPIP